MAWKVKKIEIKRLDGTRQEVKDVAVAGSYEEANATLAKMADTAPVAPHTHEVSVRIHWEDNQYYDLALALAHGDKGCVAKQARDAIYPIAGLQKPAHLTNEQYQEGLSQIPKKKLADWKAFAENHDLESPAKAVPTDKQERRTHIAHRFGTLDHTAKVPDPEPDTGEPDWYAPKRDEEKKEST